MHHAQPVVLEGAMDLISLIVIAVIVINFVAPLFKAIGRALSGAAASADKQARARLDQALQQNSASTTDARRAAELERLRRALLASAGVSDSDTSSAGAQTVAAPYAIAQPVAAPAPQPVSLSPLISATATPPPPSRVPSSRPASPRRQRRIAVTTMAPRTAPSFVAVAAPLGDDTLPSAGELLTLDSAASAFPTLPASDMATMGGRSLGSAGLTVLQGPHAGKDLVVAAAIIGPCAGTRPIGHMPGGW